MYTKVKTDQEIDNLRESSKITATILQLLKKEVAPGATTQDMAAIAHKECKAMDVKPAFLGYQGFPSVICISINNEIVHGIPKDREIQPGDLVSFDFGVDYHGMISDSALTVEVGTSTKEKQKLMNTTQEALMAGIASINGPTKIGNISAAVQAILERADLGIIRDMVGHGVGHMVHEDPNIPNYGKPGVGDLLQPGMTIAIEPMATLGDHHVTIDALDGWTVRTADGSLSAHFEHTVLITESGHEILTKINS